MKVMEKKHEWMKPGATFAFDYGIAYPATIVHDRQQDVRLSGNGKLASRPLPHGGLYKIVEERENKSFPGSFVVSYTEA